MDFRYLDLFRWGQFLSPYRRSPVSGQLIRSTLFKNIEKIGAGLDITFNNSFFLETQKIRRFELNDIAL